MKKWLLVLGAALTAISVSTNHSLAEVASDRKVEQFTCKDVMRETSPDRDASIAFLHGYLLGKSGSSTFNVDSLNKRTDAFVERCLDNPAEKAIEAISNVSK